MSINLKYLEQESIEIIRDIYSQANNPVVLYSIGKDSSVLLHLFKKAFYPSSIPVDFLHIDTTWKFKEMIEFRNSVAKKENINLKVHINIKGVEENITPFNNENYTDIMKTDALLEALNAGGYDFIFGGARRDEEKSRAKERILSYRNQHHNWDPKNQRIEPWHIFNTLKESKSSFRVFPLSNWTELNIWQYVKKEKIEVVPLYFAKLRKVVQKNSGEIFLLDDNRFELEKHDEVKNLVVRFRTLGCYPLTSGVISSAKNLNSIISEVKQAKYSERYGRLIDNDKEGSMELKKKKGYF
jgi:sulfate adenylyltransferase subunit 2